MSLTRFIHLCVLRRVFAVACHLENFIIKLRVAAKDTRAEKGCGEGRGYTVGRMEMLGSFAR